MVSSGAPDPHLLGKYGPFAEFQRPSRRWAEKRFLDIRYWNEPERGERFAAFERPELFVDEGARSSGSSGDLGPLERMGSAEIGPGR